MVKKSDENRVDGEQHKYIIVKLNYDSKLILPIADGMEFIKIWASGLQLKEPYNKPATIEPVDADFTLRFLSEKALNIMKTSMMLDPEQEDSDV